MKPVTLPLIKAHMNETEPNGNDVVAIYPMLVYYLVGLFNNPEVNKKMHS